jgi:prophage regulatory protein
MRAIDISAILPIIGNRHYRSGTQPYPYTITEQQKSCQAKVFHMQLLALREVRQQTGLSRTTIYRKIASGEFPAPLRISAGCVRWDSDDLEAWRAALPRASNDNAPSASKAS